MVNCSYDECDKRASFNIKGGKPLWCFKHKTTDMVNVKTKKCIGENCEKIPSYNIFGEKKPLYCAECKTINMVDVIHKKCCFENCTKIPTYNFENIKTPIYCYEHKLENMIVVVSKKNAYMMDVLQYQFIIQLVKKNLFIVLNIN